jgi:hypothetical protein
MVFMSMVQEEAARLDRQGTSYDGPRFCSAFSRQASLLTMNKHGGHRWYVNQYEQGLFFLLDMLEYGCAIDDDFLCSFLVLPA